jgi:uncharacterized membrane protein
MSTALQTGQPKAVADDNIYTDVYRTLVLGMTIATTLFAIGVVLAFLRSGGTSFVFDTAHAYSPRVIAAGLLHADPIAFMALGTMVTILTPISRVIVSIVVFLRDRDYTFAWITIFVLCTTVLSITLGLLGLRP